jgi:F-type H+-transporting ATPase subunit b
MKLKPVRAAKLQLHMFAAALLTLLLTAMSARAEEGSASQHSAESVFKWINFAVVAAWVIWLCLKPGPAFFGKRADTISAEIQKSTEAKNTAEKRLHDAEARVQNLENEVAELRATAKRESAAEAERIRNLTQTDTQKIEVAGLAEVDAAARAARMELKTLAANLAVDGAESLLARQLTPAAQESLINNFVKTLDRRPN